LISPETMLKNEGYLVVPNIASIGNCDHAVSMVSDYSEAGNRSFLEKSWCLNLANSIQLKLLGIFPSLKELSPVQCTLFQKKDDTNWLVSWHQDRSIPQTQMIQTNSEVTVRKKGSLTLLQPQKEVLEKVVAIRLHLDDCSTSNGPLRVIPRSHHRGILCKEAISELKETEKAIEVVAEKGSVLVMKPLLLHASSKSVSGKPRRVLHYVFM